MTSVCSAYDRPRENQIGLAARPVANVALDTDRAITEGLFQRAASKGLGLSDTSRGNVRS